MSTRQDFIRGHRAEIPSYATRGWFSDPCRKRLAALAVVLAVGVLLLRSSTAEAVTVVDWDNLTPFWVDGSASQTFSDVDGSGLNMRVTATPVTSGVAIPANLTLVNGTLEIGFDADSSGDSMTLLIEFLNATTSNLSFAIFDVDGTFQFQDELTVTGALQGGLPIDPTSMDTSAPQVLGVFGGNTIRGDTSSGNPAAFVGTAPNTEGLSEITFSGPIDSLLITYAAGPDTASTNEQGVFLTDISFVVIPEPSTLTLAGIGLCAIMAAAWRRPNIFTSF